MFIEMSWFIENSPALKNSWLCTCFFIIAKSFSVDTADFFSAVLAVVANGVVDIVIIIRDVLAIAVVVDDYVVHDAAAATVVVFVRLLCQRKPKWANISF